VEIGVQKTNFVPIHRQRYGDIGGHRALPHASLAGEHHDFVFDLAHAIRKGLLLLLFFGLFILLDSPQTLRALFFSLFMLPASF
jgi:hypothetical protein